MYRLTVRYTLNSRVCQSLVVAYASSISTPLRCLSDDDRSLSEFSGRGVRAKLVTTNFFVVYMGPGHGFINQTKEFTDRS